LAVHLNGRQLQTEASLSETVTVTALLVAYLPHLYQSQQAIGNQLQSTFKLPLLCRMYQHLDNIDPDCDKKWPLPDIFFIPHGVMASAKGCVMTWS